MRTCPMHPNLISRHFRFSSTTRPKNNQWYVYNSFQVIVLEMVVVDMMYHVEDVFDINDGLFTSILGHFLGTVNDTHFLFDRSRRWYFV